MVESQTAWILRCVSLLVGARCTFWKVCDAGDSARRWHAAACKAEYVSYVHVQRKDYKHRRERLKIQDHLGESCKDRS